MKQTPFIVINFKSVSGKRAIALAKCLNTVGRSAQMKFKIAIAIQPSEVPAISKETDLSIYIHDIYLKGSFSEEISTEFSEINTFEGVLINHPSKTSTKALLDDNIKFARSKNIKVILASKSIEEALCLKAEYLPDYIVIENPLLIGKEISIVESCPELINNALELICENVLFGAGVRSSEDLRYILESGGAGVLVSSAIVESKDPSKALADLLEFHDVF